MSHLLWKYFWENDVERFRRLLVHGGHASQSGPRSPAIGSNGDYAGSGPANFGTSPRPPAKARKSSGHLSGTGKGRDTGSTLGRAEINSRDHAGLTVLLRAASSTEPNALDFVYALLEHPAIDIHMQDLESGWNALHRSLYAGNVSIARVLLEKERADLIGHGVAGVGKVGELIKTKDHEGNSPFDVYNSTIGLRSLKSDEVEEEGASESGDSLDVPAAFSRPSQAARSLLEGDELFVFGSNKNLSLGVGDEDDRQYPERIHLKRSDQLVHRFHQSFLDEHDLESSGILPALDDIPTLIRNRPLVIHDVAMSKLHSAILTTDPVANLYVCGVGRGGRLGLGDENTQFRFCPVQGPFSDRKVRHIALGQNHSLAVAGNGELWTWGLNSDSQLGYVLPAPATADEEPMSLVPRQVFGGLKKETVLGVAASAIHSVAHTGSAMYCWGRNIGQLALMDADSRSLDIQQTPRKVAASLLSCPIEMVSAIDRATTCLLSNKNVWVFTNYGYNLIKFPLPDVLANHNLSGSSFSNRYDPGRREICQISSGGDTIAAVTARGDLFTMQLNHKVDTSQSATSTTNPVKIKGAVAVPQCIWDSRKDGVVSVSVGENGSVIICTESGAVWKRVKRVNFKNDGFVGSNSAKRKDFKFARVPYITDCVAVRSSIFGAFAAIRKDSKVMSEEIRVNDPSVCSDLKPLLCLVDFEASSAIGNISEVPKLWHRAIAREKVDPVCYELLLSPDIELDLEQWLRANYVKFEDSKLFIRTSILPSLMVPVHSWIMAGRSPAVREAIFEFRNGVPTRSDGFVIEEVEQRLVVTLLDVDVFSMLNVVVYAYQDSIIPIWRYTREWPQQAHRFRGIRTELMKLATKLQMPKLEAAARLQVAVEPSLNVDLLDAIDDPRFFDDADVLLELDGAEVPAHGQLLCHRCPFFEGLFHGRSGGRWLAGRREEIDPADQLRIDLKHINPNTFQYVLAFLYSDNGPEMFDEVSLPSIDDFSELVLDIMGVANELMLDRLSQICQFLIGKFVTTRNISNLLNEISPCSVTAFKTTGLEYTALQLETMLENSLLDSLDAELIQELDEVVRDNQLARLPFARSGRADHLLHEQYPELAGDIEEERQRRVKEMAFRLMQREEDKKLSSSFRSKLGSLDDSTAQFQTPDKSQRKARRNEPFSPHLRPKSSQGEMIFDMDDEEVSAINSRKSSPTARQMVYPLDLDIDAIPPLSKTPQDQAANSLSQAMSFASTPTKLSKASPGLHSQTLRVNPWETPPRDPRTPWGAEALPTAKVDMKGILSESTPTSALTASLAAQKLKDATSTKGQSKMSQKERKKQMQSQAEAQAAAREEAASRVPWEKVPAGGKPPPWKPATPTTKTSLKDAMAAEQVGRSALPVNAKPLVAAETSSKSAPRRTGSPDTRFSGQGRASSSSTVPQTSSKSQEKRPLVPHSKSYFNPAPKSEPTVRASMADIIGQQRREQEKVKEAVAKRPLQDIQQEQEFQEWWDQESRRAQEEEARRQAKDKGKADQGGKRGRRGRGGKTKSGDGADTPNKERNVTADMAKAGPGGRGGSAVRGRSVKGKSH